MKCMRLGVSIGVLAAALLFAATACSSAPDAAPASSVLESTTGTTSLPAPTRSTETISEAPTTIVSTPTGPTLIPPPASTPEPAPTTADCPYLPTAEVADANGQRVGKTATITTKPYPICIFYRPDGTVMAMTRIVVADSPAAAAAAVNQHVPIDESFPATHPAGWTGGAMATPNGVPGYPDAGSIYAVSKGSIAVIAISNQKQSIKGRQMVTDVVKNLGL